MLGRVPHPYSREDALAWLTLSPFGLILNGREAFAITVRGKGLIGMMGLDEQEGAVRFGYWLAPPFWSRGYASEAGRAVVDLAFSVFDPDALVADYYIDNPASGRVLEKLGFAPAGPVAPHPCLARGTDVPAQPMALDRQVWWVRTRHDRPALAS
ncbi:MAG: GNAT family N-acetyltransferase, partial [Alphaproteobacteria bacterium]|nr:GNAT family N-acetyltransferase [Alphaproteobacteria bacterium]